MTESSPQQPPDETQRVLIPMTELQIQQFEDLDWAVGNESLEEQFPGQLVVVWRKQVLAHGHNPIELPEQASTPEHPREELVLVPILDPFCDIPH